MIKIGILGGAGYTAGELIRLLIHHPEVKIVFANSESNAGNPVAAVHEGLYGDTDLTFTDQTPFDQVDVLNKAAQIYIAGRNMGFEPEGMSDAQLKELTVTFCLPK